MRSSAFAEVSQLQHVLFLKGPRLDTLDQLIHPRSESIGRFANLELYNGHSAECIPVGAKIRVIVYMRIHIVASPAIALRGPKSRTRFGRGGIAALQPHVWCFVEFVFADAIDEV